MTGACWGFDVSEVTRLLDRLNKRFVRSSVELLASMPLGKGVRPMMEIEEKGRKRMKRLMGKDELAS